MDPEQSITRLIGLARTGDPEAAERLWQAYFHRLVALARDRLAPAARRAADEEDVALSAFASFWAGARDDRFPQLTDRTALWPLLVAIIANKCTDLIRRETRQKRGAGTVQDASAIEHLIGREPPPEFACQVADQLSHLLAQLDQTGDPTLRKVATLRMTGLTQAEIADELGYVRETVARKLRLIELCWVAGADDDG
jgi:RNA polymerase sigma factor (sigma-70 family)